MLYWHFRILQCILMSFFKSKVRPDQTLTSTFWANPFDSDWMNSIQAGRFFTYTDAARWEIAVRMGFMKLALRKKLIVILGGQRIIYRRPVRIFRRFNIVMRLTGWDEKWMYAAHSFEQSGKVCCVSLSKVGLRTKEGLHSPIKALEELGYRQIIPPEWVLEHFKSDLETLETIRSKLVSDAE